MTMPFLPPSGFSGVQREFGSFSFHDLSGGNVQIEGTWETQNLITLRNVCGTGLNIRLHKRLAVWFAESLGAAMKAAPAYRVRMLGGFCSRHKNHNPKEALSVHSWGAAFDVNWDTNPMSKVLVTDLPPEFVKAFSERGWQWGGGWAGSKDAMHFQFATGV